MTFDQSTMKWFTYSSCKAYVKGSAFISYKALKRILLFIRDTLKLELKPIKDLPLIILPSSPACATKPYLL